MSIKFECNNFRVKTELSMQSNTDLAVSFIVDTGAVVTTMSIKSLSKLIHFSESAIKAFIDDKAGKEYKDITKNTIKSVPLLLRNVCIGDMKLDEFRVMVCATDTSVNVLGMDFLTAAITILSEDKCMELTSWNNNKYKGNWSETLNGIEVYEVNALQHVSTVASLLKKAEG